MEQIGKILSQAEQEKSLATTQQPSQPSWAGLLWTLAQSRSKELSTPEIALWKAKLSGYPAEIVEWALINYNGEFFPNPSTICRMVEVKRESLLGEQQNREWDAYRAAQSKAEREGKLATDEDYENLRRECREIIARSANTQRQDRGRMVRSSVVGVEQPIQQAGKADTTKG